MTYAARCATPDSILDFFQEFSVEASDGKVRNPTVVPGLEQEKPGSPLDSKAVYHSKVNRRNLVKFVEFVDSTDQADRQVAEHALMGRVDRGEVEFGSDRHNQLSADIRNRFAASNTVRGRGTLKTVIHDNPAAGAVPCYFLPWYRTGGAVEMKIPGRGDGPGSDDHPHFFLTAALSGCSIYVEGPANAPRVFHCGTEFNTPADREASEFWDSLVRKYELKLSAAESIHSRDYMTPTRGARGQGTFDETVAKGMLQKQYDRQLRIETTSNWGAVFGVRRGADWSFYLQENSSITYTKLRTTSVLKRLVVDGEPVTVCRPLVVRQIFPAGGGRATLFSNLRDLTADR